MSNPQNFSENDDLLSILGSSLSSNTTEVVTESLGSTSGNASGSTSGLGENLPTKSEDDIEVDKKLSDLRDLADALQDQNEENPGSGDLDKDLADWFSGEQLLPSVPLNQYVGNTKLKMDYGISKFTLSSFDMMGKLHKFMDSGFDMLFSESALMSMSPDEVESRMKMAFTMYRELAVINNRAVLTMRDQNNRYSEDTNEIDRLSMLLSSIPNEKLEQILTSLTASTKKEK